MQDKLLVASLLKFFSLVSDKDVGIVGFVSGYDRMKLEREAVRTCRLGGIGKRTQIIGNAALGKRWAIVDLVQLESNGASCVCSTNGRMSTRVVVVWITRLHRYNKNVLYWMKFVQSKVAMKQGVCTSRCACAHALCRQSLAAIASFTAHHDIEIDGSGGARARRVIPFTLRCCLVKL